MEISDYYHQITCGLIVMNIINIMVTLLLLAQSHLDSIITQQTAATKLGQIQYQSVF
jgi:hypothetical protein